LRDLRDRGLKAPMLAVGDGALGLWAALREVFPETAHPALLEPICRPPDYVDAWSRTGRRVSGPGR
jgi:transposase-like protein